MLHEPMLSLHSLLKAKFRHVWLKPIIEISAIALGQTGCIEGREYYFRWATSALEQMYNFLVRLPSKSQRDWIVFYTTRECIIK